MRAGKVKGHCMSASAVFLFMLLASMPPYECTAYAADGGNAYTPVCENRTSNDVFRIVKPNGGETFYVGDQCTVVVHAESKAELILRIGTGEGLVWADLPQIANMMAPDDSVFIFTIDSAYTTFSEGPISVLSDSCAIRAVVYTEEWRYDETDCFFRVVADPAAAALRHSSAAIAYRPKASGPANFFDVRGRSLAAGRRGEQTRAREKVGIFVAKWVGGDMRLECRIQ